MSKIILFSPSISTLNRGDEIITQACKKYIRIDEKEDFTIEISTHLPLLNNYMSIIGDTKYKIVMGSNLLRGKVNHSFKPWHIGLRNADFLKNTILMGVGWWTYNDMPNLYTKHLYDRILSKTAIHSVRDEYTKNMLERIGIKNVVNTGCPTMWQLDQEHCKKIPHTRSSEVVFTLTDYNKNKRLDKMMIDILKGEYSKIHFWIQGWGDIEYLRDLLGDDIEKIHIIGSSLNEYEMFLNSTDCDYVGTRLHAGIKAMQCLKRSIIIGIDNRAREIKRDYNINYIDRDMIENDLTCYIDSSFETNICLNENNINTWLNQFD